MLSVEPGAKTDGVLQGHPILFDFTDESQSTASLIPTGEALSVSILIIEDLVSTLPPTP